MVDGTHARVVSFVVFAVGFRAAEGLVSHGGELLGRDHCDARGDMCEGPRGAAWQALRGGSIAVRCGSKAGRSVRQAASDGAMHAPPSMMQ